MKIRIDVNKIRRYLKKTPLVLAERTFICFLVILFLDLIFGAIVFYRYSILSWKEPVESREVSLEFNEKLYQKILKEIEQREKRFLETEFKDYPNPFKSSEPVELSPPGELTQ